MTRITFLSAAGLWLAASANAQGLAPLEAYSAIPSADLMVISPSGRRIAYRSTRDGQDVILVLETQSRRLAGGIAVGEISPRQLEFIDDDNLVAIAGRTMNAAGYRRSFDFSGAMHFHVPSQEARMLLGRARDLYPGQSGVGRIVGVDEGRKNLLMPAFHSKDPREPNPRYGVYSVALRSDRARIARRGTNDTIDWFADSTGNFLARVDFEPDLDTYRIWALEPERKLIYERDTELAVSGPAGVMPDSKALAFRVRQSDEDLVTLYRMSLVDGELTGPALERNTSGIERVLTDINRVVHGVEYAGFTPSYEFFDATIDDRVQRILASLAGTSATVTSWSDDFRDIIVRISGGWNSGVYLLYADNGTDPEVLAGVRPEITGEQVVPVEVTEYPASDGLVIPALVTALPALRETGGAPMIVLPHGGPESHDVIAFDWMAQYFASRGYVVLQPQFRGSTGFGVSFIRAGYGEWGGKMQSDIDDGVDFLVSSGLADPDRICILGASYGGYAALAAGAFTPEKYRCVASVAGVTDLERMLGTNRRVYGRDHWVNRYWERQFGGEDFDWDALEKISPARYADRFSAPVLLLHGNDDTVVPIEQSTVMARALRNAGKDVTLVQLSGEDHWLSYPETRAETLLALSDFVERSIGPEANDNPGGR